MGRRASGWRAPLRAGLAGWMLAAVWRAEAGGEDDRLLAREAELAAAALTARNAALTADVDALREQVRTLTVSLAVARAELDVLKARLDDGAWRAAQAATPAATLAREAMGVVEANAEMDLVVLDAGSRDGVRAGMRVSVLRRDAVIARAKVVDVRETISGALVEKVEKDFPKAGDRAVVARTETRER